ncbi:MAG: adenylate kinase [Firmicutes bacterium]|nr:adenylate kinase [Bacillota bacterium]
MNIIILGAQGSGKGTQCEKLKQHYNIPHIATGDILRYNIKMQTELGKKVEPIVKSGALVPDDILIELMGGRIKEADAEKGFLLDGFPRTLAQAVGLENIKAIDVCVYIEVDQQALIQRLSNRRMCDTCGNIVSVLTHTGDVCGKASQTTSEGESKGKVKGEASQCKGKLFQRDDDKPEAIKTRLDAFYTQTFPLIDYYKNQNKLARVDGNQSVEQVFTDIKEALLKAGF